MKTHFFKGEALVAHTSNKKKFKRFNWRNLRIGYKYLFAFIFAALLFFAVGGIVFYQLMVAVDDIEQIEQDSVRTNNMARLATLIQEKDVLIADFIISEDDTYNEQFQTVSEEFNTLLTSLETEMQTAEQQQIFQEILANDELVNKALEDILSVPEGLEYLLSSYRGHANTVSATSVELLDDLIAMIQKDQSNSVLTAKSSLNSSVFIILIAGAVAVIVGSFLLLIISRNITNNLNNVVQITSEVSKGNLTVPSMSYEGRDEIGLLASAINEMKENIKGILLNVNDATQSVSSSSEELTQSASEVNEGSEQIAQTMEELSRGAESQAHTASELAINMGDFVDVVKTSESESEEVAHTSKDVINVTSEGTVLMSKAVEQMTRIDRIVAHAVKQVQGLDQQSQAITQLVHVIQDIAEQTNLLALNAAIEAARAGEHGQGFAVVADEVRKLAEEVSTSVSEITTIVNNIQGETTDVVSSLSEGYEEVKEGTLQIEKTGETFTTIDHAVSEMAKKVVAISTNLQNLAENSQEMNNFIGEIASISEEAAAGVEQTAASSQQSSSAMDEILHSSDHLAKLAEELNIQVGRFKLE